MALKLKSPQEIDSMRRAGLVVRETMKEIEELIAPNITTNDIEQAARAGITSRGAVGSFNQVPGYSWFTCTPVNEQIVHTPPSNRTLRLGDVVTVDIGACVDGLHVDHAQTFCVGECTKHVSQFLDVGKKTLAAALATIRAGSRLGEASAAMQHGIESAGYHIVKPLVGHGVGYTLHEDPIIPCFVEKKIEKTLKWPVGLTVAIEVMYGMSSGQMKYEKGNKWSIVTADGSIAAQFEHTIAILEHGIEILT